MPVERRAPGAARTPCMGLRPPGNRPGERRLAVPGRSQSCSNVPVHLIKLRLCGTPETIVVRTHTFPGHDNGPQAELASR